MLQYKCMYKSYCIYSHLLHVGTVNSTSLCLAHPMESDVFSQIMSFYFCKGQRLINKI